LRFSASPLPKPINCLVGRDVRTPAAIRRKLAHQSILSAMMTATGKVVGGETISGEELLAKLARRSPDPPLP